MKSETACDDENQLISSSIRVGGGSLIITTDLHADTSVNHTKSNDSNWMIITVIQRENQAADEI